MPTIDPSITSVLRPVAERDATAVLALGRSIFDWPTERVLWNRGMVEWYCRETAAVSFVAEDAGTLAGFVLCFMEGSNGYLGWIAVAPAVRHRGLGTSLLWAACEALRRQGAVDVASDVRCGAEAEFFAQTGFKDTGLRKAILTKRLTTG